MRLYRIFATCVVVTMNFGVHHLDAQTLTGDAWKLEAKGNAAEAREQLQKAANLSPNDPLALEAYAEFLGEHRDPAARAAYEKLWQLLNRNGANAAERARAARRLAELDLLAGDRPSAEKHLAAFHSAGGNGLNLPAASAAPRFNYIEIPGPLRSFARMAAISPDIAPEDVMASLAHNITLNGYSATRASESLEPTEYLKLVIRYLSQARELEKLAGPEKILRVDMCESTVTGDLLRILGYRMRGGCGSDVVLETVNPSRAFLTIDSGFPLSELEGALRTNRPFTWIITRRAFASFMHRNIGSRWWQARNRRSLSISSWAIPPSAACIPPPRRSIPIPPSRSAKTCLRAKAKIYAHVLDFFGSMFEMRDGKAMVPGGARSEKMWAELVGVSPEKGAAFFERLVEKDDGWLASYYDSLARINGPVEDYLTEPERLKRFYMAMRGRVTSPGPARPVFRANTDMVLLTTRLRLDADGKPHLPGGLDVWKNLFAGKAQAKYDQRIAKAAPNWKDSEEVIEAMFGLSRKIVENEALKIFMALTDIERNRAKPLETNTVDRLVRDYKALGAQYPLFAEAPAISDATLVAYLDAANAITQIRDIALRADAAGTLQALAGFWQVFVRQRSIPPAEADGALSAVLQGFSKVQSERDVFDAGQKGLVKLLAAAHAPNTGSQQDHIMDLLAGTKAAGDVALSDAHTQMIEDMTRVFEAQRLVSLDTILTLADRLEAAAAGQKLDAAHGRAPGGAHHGNSIAAHRLNHTRTNRGLRRILDRETHRNRAQAESARRHRKSRQRSPETARLTRRAGAGAARHFGRTQLHSLRPARRAGLVHQSAFVRSHDFFGSPDHQRTWLATEVFGSGWPSQRRRAAGRLADRAALRARRSGTKLPDSVPRTGAHLGRPGSANDFERRDSALVERDPHAIPLGGLEHGVRRIRARAKRR